MSNKNKQYLVLIIALAAGLRLIGITHSFPFIFHPDEPTIVRSALGIRFNPNPGHFDWPHLYIYLNYLLFMLFAKVRDLITSFGYKETITFVAPIIYNDNLIFYLLTRALTAILGALTVIPLYLSGKLIFNEKVGLLSALALAIAPFHVWHSHYSLADVPMLFFMSWALYFSVKILFLPNISNYFLAGIFAGLAASTKYNGAIIVLAIIFAHFLRTRSEKSEKFLSVESLESLIYAGISSVFAFLVGTPYALLDYKTFLRTDNARGALWQFTNVGSLSFSDHFTSFILVFPNKLAENFGYTFIILFVFSIFYLLYRIYKDKSLMLHKDLFFLISLGLVYIFYISGFASDRAHYYFVAYPLVILAGIGAFNNFLSHFNWRIKNVFWAILFTPPLVFSAINSYLFYQPETRVMLYRDLQDKSFQNKPIYYNDTELQPVFEKLNLKSEKIPDGALVPNTNSVLVTTQAENGYKLTAMIDNRWRRGPKIYIYRF